MRVTSVVLCSPLEDFQKFLLLKMNLLNSYRSGLKTNLIIKTFHRTIYQKKKPELLKWEKPDIDATVLDILYENTPGDPAKVDLKIEIYFNL